MAATGLSAPQMKRRQTLLGQHPITSSSSMLDMYEPLDVIGSGSFGIIRKVKKKDTGVILARKELNYRKMEERDLKQLNEEVLILQNMPKNEYIVEYCERFLDKQNQTLHIIMEYCENGDLSHVISQHRANHTLIPEDTVWMYLTQLTIALADCHAETDINGRRKAVVLHRDIKPENVFLNKDGVVKLGDFGLSKAMASSGLTNTYVGTPYYMSPELIGGAQYDCKSDIWAFGCLIYELCAWHPPFHQAQTQVELVKLINNGKMPPIPSAYSQTLSNMIKAMLRQDYRQRPTAKQVLGHEHVKLFIRIMAFNKKEDEYSRRTRELQARELSVAMREQSVLHLLAKDAELKERERYLALKEEQLRLAQQEFEFEKDSLTTAMAGPAFSISRHTAASVMSTSASSSASSDSLFADQDENRHPSGGSTASSLNTDTQDHKLKVASRPSLVPRRGPLEERRSIGSLTRRLSNNSLMSLDEPRFNQQHTFPSPGNHGGQRLSILIPPSATLSNSKPTVSVEGAARRRIHSSRSMYNLNSATKQIGKTLFPSYSRDSLRSFAQAQSHEVPPSPVRSSLPVDRDGSIDNLASQQMQPYQQSPSKRNATTAFASPQEMLIGSSIQHRPTQTIRTHTAPTMLCLPPAAEYNMEDDENLPSPFLKKKASRQASSSRQAARAPPPVPSRTLRPSTSRLSLANKLAIGRTTRSQAQPSAHTD